MGLTTTFVYTRDGGGWQGVDDRSLEDVSSLPARPLLAAHVEDSDWCVVLGRDPAGREWSWVFGEESALGSRQAQRWLVTLDPDDLDDTLPRRAASAAGEVVAWAQACDLGSLPVDAVTEVLLDPDVFAETGWRRLLALLGLDDVAVEEVEDTRPMPPLDEGPRPMPPPRAIALDHSHPGWRRLNAGDLLWRFGEPPCLLQWQRSLYLATDPPVHLFSCDESRVTHATGATGAWTTVPASATGSLAAAAAWAAAHVGTAGAPMPADRPPLLLEVIDHEREARRPRHRRAQEWKLHEPAPPVSAALLVAWRDAGAEVAAEAIARVHDLVIGRLVGAFTAHGRGVVYGDQGSPRPGDLEVTGEVVRANGRIAKTTASPAAWSRLVRNVSRGEVNELYVQATRTTGLGLTSPPHATASVGHHLHLVDDPDDFDLGEDRQSQDRQRPQPPWLALGIDAEFAAVLPVSSLLDLLHRFADDLPVHHARLRVGRSVAGTEPWLLVQPVEDSWDQAVYPHAEVRAGLRWLRSDPDQPKFEPRVN